MAIDYTILPEHCRDGMRRYVENGIQPGSFLTSVLCNDFVGACVNADDINIRRLVDYAYFLWNELPGEMWGDPDTVMNYSKTKRQERAEARHEVYK